MKSILMSIKPKWCELILSGKKTIEVRKTAPKETPFKVYIYCTKGNMKDISDDGRTIKDQHYQRRGKVIGEFVCDKVDDIDGADAEIEKASCMSLGDLYRYAKGKDLKALHISDLKIYDTPKELSEFFVKGECSYEDYSLCCRCKNFHRGRGWLDGSYCDEDDCVTYGIKPLIRAPQSWCYVER